MQHWKRHSVLRYILLNELPFIGGVDPEHDQTVVATIRVDFLEMTYLLVAGRSSNSPLEEPNVLSSEIRKLNRLSLQ